LPPAALFKAGEHLRLPDDEKIVITMLWVRRLLLGNCPAKDQRIMLKLFAWSTELVAWSVWAYGLKLLFMRFHGNECIRLVRLLRDIGYLMLMTLEDRQRLLYFLLRQRITPGTQEAAASLFESCTPKQTELILKTTDVRLLRFSVGGPYWRRIASSLSNPYLTAAAIYGLEISPITGDH
jgi:hypothetical protein